MSLNQNKIMSKYGKLSKEKHERTSARIVTDSDFIFTEHNLDTKEEDL